MKKNRKYIFILVGTLVIFVLFNLFSPKEINWEPSFSAQDKNPFGSFLIDALMPAIFPSAAIHNSNLTLYELDSLMGNESIIILAENIVMDKTDTEVLLNKVDDGATALLAASYFSGTLKKTLGIHVNSVISKKILDFTDTSYVEFVNPSIKKARYRFKLEHMHVFFEHLDSLKNPAFVVARNSYKDPVILRIPRGRGQLILTTLPLAFTNHYLLSGNRGLIESTLSHLPIRNLWWTEYYQTGRLESMSPLRVILRDKALSWAYYILIFSVLIFMIFEAKRRQRIIPVIKALPNTTLEFIKTIGNMYIQAGDHKVIAEKKINYFFDSVRAAYFLPGEKDESFAEMLAKKSGNPPEETKSLMALIRIIQASPAISSHMLLDLNKRFEKFNHVPHR